MGSFAGIGKEKSASDSTYLAEGDYSVGVTCVRLVTSQKDGREFFVVEFDVVEATGDRTNVVAGDSASWLCALGGAYPETALRDVKTFISALTGAKDGDIDEKFVDDLIEDDGEKVVGLGVRVRVVEKSTRSGKTFSKHHWRAAPEGDTPF